MANFAAAIASVAAQFTTTDSRARSRSDPAESDLTHAAAASGASRVHRANKRSHNIARELSEAAPVNSRTASPNSPTGTESARRSRVGVQSSDSALTGNAASASSNREPPGTALSDRV